MAAVAAALGGGALLCRADGGPTRRSLLATNLLTQIALLPVAYTKGTDFKPAMRPEPDSIIHWDTW